jgi:hypothetical protein
MQDRALAAAHHALAGSYEDHFAEGRRLAPEDAVARLLSGAREVPEPSAP